MAAAVGYVALSGFDRPQMLQGGYLIELPFGKGRKLATEGISAAIFGNWQINGLFSAFQGGPFTVTASGNEPTWSDSPREVGYFLESSR